MEDLQKEVMTDALTGIANRKHFDMLLRQMAAQAMEDGDDLCVAFGTSTVSRILTTIMAIRLAIRC